jgi:hypothetical protein
MVPPSLTRDQIAALADLTHDPPIVPPAAPSHRPTPLTPAQCARLILPWYTSPLPDSPEAHSLVPTSSRFPLYGTLDLDQKAAMSSWAAAEQQLSVAFEQCGVACPSLLERLVDLALDRGPAANARKHAVVCSVKRLLRCITPQDPAAPSYLNVERGSLTVVDDLERRLNLLIERTEGAVAPGMQKRHTVVWSDVGITSTTHSEYAPIVFPAVFV